MTATRFPATSLLAFLALVAAGGALAQPGQTGADLPFGSFGRGVNFGNALEAPREGEWGLTLREDYVRAIADAGFDTVRLPVKWSAHAAPQAPYTIDPAFLARVDEVVGWILDHGLQVIVDFHHYDEMATAPAAHVERWLGIWRQVAGHYAAAPEELAFELLNEPHGALAAPAWNALLARGLEVVRESNPTRRVVIGPANWNAIGALPQLRWPDDPNLVLTVHYYDPFEFTHQEAEWVSPSPPGGVTWPPDLAPRAGWQDWSWDTARDYGPELVITYNAGWAGYYLQADQPVTGYSELVVRVSADRNLIVNCGPTDETGVHFGATGGVGVIIDTAACGGAGGVTRVFVQNGTPDPQEPFVIEVLELRGPAGVMPLFSGARETMAQSLDTVVRWAAENGDPPVFLGEFGAYGRAADLDSRVRWTSAVRELSEERGFSWAYWEFGAGFGVYDVDTDTWRTELLRALIP